VEHYEVTSTPCVGGLYTFKCNATTSGAPQPRLTLTNPTILYRCESSATGDMSLFDTEKCPFSLIPECMAPCVSLPACLPQYYTQNPDGLKLNLK
jgi:hypothetical protein